MESLFDFFTDLSSLFGLFISDKSNDREKVALKVRTIKDRDITILVVKLFASWFAS